MLVHDLQCSEMQREQLLYRRKISRKFFSALRAASDVTPNGRSTTRELPTGLETKGCFKLARVISVAVYKTTMCKQVDHFTFTLLLNYHSSYFSNFRRKERPIRTNSNAHLVPTSSQPHQRSCKIYLGFLNKVIIL